MNRGTKKVGAPKGEPVCIHCKRPLKGSRAVTNVPPPGQMPLDVGAGWSICGDDCPSLPPGSLVYYRRQGWK